MGLRNQPDDLNLRSSVAMVVDQHSKEILFEKNPDVSLPIASITKLMTAMVVLDAALPLDEILEISTDDIDTEKGSRSRLRPGTRLSRAELLHLALMASENRAAHALGRHYPGGLDAFVAAMNAKARQIGMLASRFNDPTGLSGRNMASARDLARMMQASGTAAVLDLAAIPIHADAVVLADRLAEGRTPLDHALGDGEDFELLLAMPAAEALRLVAAPPPTDVRFTVIGEVVAGAGIAARAADGTTAALVPRGYEHAFDG